GDLLQSSDMTDFLIDFEWFRCPDGYRMAHASEIARVNGEVPETYPNDDWIVPKSRRQISYRPLKEYDTLCNVFAKVRSADDLLGFVNSFGPLTQATPYWGDSVPGVLKSAQRIRGLLLCKQQGPRKIESLFKAQLRDGVIASYREVGATAAEADLEGLNR